MQELIINRYDGDGGDIAFFHADTVFYFYKVDTKRIAVQFAEGKRAASQRAFYIYEVGACAVGYYLSVRSDEGLGRTFAETEEETAFESKTVHSVVAVDIAVAAKLQISVTGITEDAIGLLVF